jgi:Flp pilus assembly protein TadD
MPAAIAQYRAVLAVNPDNAAALNNLAWLLSEAGDPEGARIRRARATSMAPFNASVVDTLGWTLFKTGDAARGTQLLRLARTSRRPIRRSGCTRAGAAQGRRQGRRQARADPLLALPPARPHASRRRRLLAGK